MAHVGGQRISPDYRDRRPSAPPCTSHAHEVCTERVSQHSCVWLRELCAEENTGEATTHSRCRVYVSGSTQVAFAIPSRVGQKLKKQFLHVTLRRSTILKRKSSAIARETQRRGRKTQHVHRPYTSSAVFHTLKRRSSLAETKYKCSIVKPTIEDRSSIHTHDEAWNIFPLVLPPVHNTGVCTHRSSPSKGEGVLLRDVEKPGRIGSHLPGR